MQAISRIVLIAALAAVNADAQPAQTPASAAVPQAGAVRGPVSVTFPPAPPELAPLSQEFQAAMANSQLQTYRYNQLTEQALALKKLCDTGFGPADVCPRRTAEALDGTASSAGNTAELPTIAEITGTGQALNAKLVLPDGRLIVVRPGSMLPDGSMVTSISAEEVRLGRGPDRHEANLAFGDGAK
jgi:type IV pilus biogenesis protein PilP